MVQQFLQLLSKAEFQEIMKAFNEEESLKIKVGIIELDKSVTYYLGVNLFDFEGLKIVSQEGSWCVLKEKSGE